jgi:hypothetical protein
MSRVTNLILSFSTGENEEKCMSVVNSYQYRNITLNLVSIDYNKNVEKGYCWYGGTKFMEANLYVGAFNHFDLDDFVAFLKTVKWEEPEDVQLIVKEEWETKFRIIEIV